MTTLRQLGEVEVIRRLAAGLPTSDDVRIGIGDDTAVIASGEDDLLLTSDAVVEGAHFEPATAPRRIGRKAVARALSDIAAMGGRPAWALIDLVTPGDAPMRRIEEVYAGAAAMAARHRLALVGGDTTEGPVLELHVFVVGRVPCGQALLRSTARPGSGLYVTGALGGSLAGRHLDFEPRLREADWLRSGGWAESLIDVSDGLAADARRLIEQSGVGARIELARIPCADAARDAGDGRTAIDHALNDGEDFELLFTVPPARCAAFPAAWAAAFDLPCTRIGAMIAAPRELLLRDPSGVDRPLSAGGYQHFAGGGR